jgi:hypothetical protein
MQTNHLPALRLLNHQLVDGKRKTPKEVVAWLGAVQAQDFGMAKWALGIRLPGCTEGTVDEAFNRGQILRTHVMRPTWHFVTPENIRWMLALSADRIKASAKSRDRELEITETLYRQTSLLIQKALEGHKQLTREELGGELEKANIGINTARLYHILMRAEVEGVVCSGALKGKTHTYALLDERVPPVPPAGREEALARLAGIYFTSHSPATLQDFAWWSGLSLTEARIGLNAVQTDFFAEKTAGETYWIASVPAGVPAAEASVHLLPAFDEYIIGYRNRSAVLSSENFSKAVSSNGVFRPAILVNGIVAGLWKKTASGRQPVQLDFFTSPDVDCERLTLQAADMYRAFLNRP